MKYFYDLHIHSALSPCADVLMSPNNILNMAMLKELQIIAVTDHNSCLQLDVIEELKDSYEMLIVPGAEVEVKEHYHVLCLFRSFEDARKFQKNLDLYLNVKMHDEEIYGEQNIFNAFDDIIHNHQISLMGSSNIGLLQLRKMIDTLDGVMILAHIEKYKDGIVEKIKTIYHDVFDAIEVNANYDITKIENELNTLTYNIIRDSDAHQIMDISEPIHTIELAHLTIDDLFCELKRKKNG